MASGRFQVEPAEEDARRLTETLEGVEALEASLAADAREHLLPFIMLTKESYEPAWFHRALCSILETIETMGNRRIIISMPPRHGKSEIFTRKFPAWYMGRNPNKSVILLSYSGDIAMGFASDVQKVMDSEIYRRIFPEVRLPRLRGNDGLYKRVSDYFELPGYEGKLASAGVGGSVTSKGGHLIIFDDPIKNRDEAESKTYRDRVWNFFTSSVYTRLEKDATIIIVLTRWHDDDIAGRLIAQSKKKKHADKWDVFKFPAIMDERHLGKNPFDKRMIGEVIYPEKYPLDRVLATRETIGERDFSSLYQCEPGVASGNVFKREWFRYYHKVDLPAEWDWTIISIDAANEEDTEADYTVITVWSVKGTQIFLRKLTRFKATYLRIVEAAYQIALAHPEYNEIHVEKKGSGIALYEELRERLFGVMGQAPNESKTIRAQQVSSMFLAGNVLFPSPEDEPWVLDFEDEVLAFPTAEHDDQVDSMTQALRALKRALHVAESDVLLFDPLARFDGLDGGA